MNTSKLACLALVALVLGACQKETDKNTPPAAGKACLPEIVAEVEQAQASRSTVSVDENGTGTILWQPYDAINVFFGTKGAVYVSQNTRNAASAPFRTTDESAESAELESDNIWGLYPYDRNAACDGASVTTTLPGHQYGVPGTFADDLFITLAHSATNTLKFFNVCGGIKFSLTRSDIASVTFKGNHDEDIAGDISLTFADGAPKATVVNGIKEITLTPLSGSAFNKGTDYYIITLPVALSGGFTITFTTTSGSEAAFAYTDKPVSIQRSSFGRKADFDTYASFVGIKTLRYTTSDGQLLTLPRPDGFGAAIASHTYENGVGTITFDAPMTTIGDYAFSGCKTLTSIDLPEGLKRIGNRAFEFCTGLTSMVIPDSVTDLGSVVFSNSGVTSVSIGDIVETKSMNSPLGGGNNLSVTVREGVRTIGESVFSGCSFITSISLPESLTSIGRSAFYNCRGLSAVTIPAAVTEIGEHAFRECKNLTSMEIPAGITRIAPYTFQLCTGLTSVSLPDGLTEIGDYAFGNCTGLTAFTIPTSVTTIGNRAFEFCTGLTSMVIPDSVTDLGSVVFSNSGVTSVSIGDIVETKSMNSPLGGGNNLSVTVREGVRTIGESVFSGCSFITSISLPESLTSIGRSAFYNCRGLSAVTIPAAVTEIGEHAFRECKNLTSMEIPAGITRIAPYTFQLCTGLTSVSLPDGLTEIGDYAFGNCTGLTAFTIPTSVTTIGNRAFEYCTSLDEVQCKPATPPGGGTYMFYYASDCPIYVPSASVEAYKDAQNWSIYASRIQAMP